MASSKRPTNEGEEPSTETLFEWARRRPVLAIVLFVCAVAIPTVVVAWNWSSLGGEKPGPRVIHGSPWEKRKAPGGPKAD